MDIKEIALKHSREYLTFKLGGRKGLDIAEIVCDDEIYAEIVDELAHQFEAFIAEIANETAEACAKYVNRFLNGDGIQDEAWIRDIESGIRRGAWKEFK